MKIIISTHQGKMYDEEVDYIVVKSQDGEFAIMRNHIPVVAVIASGYIKLNLNSQELFVAIENGILEYSQNKVEVIAQAAHIGRDKESAMRHLKDILKERLNSNRQSNIDSIQKEKEILDNLRKTKAGNL